MIKTLIFDWGGVLTIGRYTPAILTVLSKKGMSIEKEGELFNEYIIQMNAGEISFKEFVLKINSRFQLKITEKEMENVFKEAIIPNENVIVLVRTLAKQYQMILLSDNDEATLKNINKYHKHMLDLFSKTYFSHELKMRKPNQKLFTHVLTDAKITPAETIFIDDKPENVESAVNLGMKGIVFSSIDQLKKELASFSVKIH